MRFVNCSSLLLSVVLTTDCLILWSGILSGQRQPTSAPWDALKRRGLELRQNLVLGDYRLALQDDAWIQSALHGPGADSVARNIRSLGSRAPLASDLEPSLTTPLVPVADKLLQAIDESDGEAVFSLGLQLFNQIHGVFIEAPRRRSTGVPGLALIWP